MGYRYLTFDDRRLIERCYEEGASAYDIARALGVGVATVYNELKRGCTGDLDANKRNGYSASLGQQRLEQNFRQRGNRSRHESNFSRGIDSSVIAEYPCEQTE